ncbi:MAG: hypothetical protein AAFU67_02880 [Bacteroidota bacterium]
MRQSLFPILLFAVVTSLMAQPAAEDAYLDKLAKSTCDCFSEKTASGNVNNLELTLGTCMIQYVEETRTEYESIFGAVNYTDQLAMQQLGERTGVKMLSYCPDLIMKLGMESMEEEAAAKSDPPTLRSALTGTLVSVTGDDILTVTVKESSGRPVKLLWLRYFPGSDKLIDAEQIVGKKLRIEFESIDVYSKQSGDYVTRREIRSLEVID